MTDEYQPEPSLAWNANVTKDEVIEFYVETLVPLMFLMLFISSGPIILCLTNKRTLESKHMRFLAKKIPWFTNNKSKACSLLSAGTSIEDKTTKAPNKVTKKWKNIAQRARIEDAKVTKENFLTDFDKAIIESIDKYHSRIQELLKLSIPALGSLALCPLTIFSYDLIVLWFWPGYITAPDVNVALACFLIPMGIVYATSFGFAYNQAATKQITVKHRLAHEIAILDQIATMASQVTFSSKLDRMAVYQAVKGEILVMILDLQNRTVNDIVATGGHKVSLKRMWGVFDVIRQIPNDRCKEDRLDFDNILAKKLVSHSLTIVSVCGQRRQNYHTRIRPLQWFFLECLGFFSFFGILFVWTLSYKLALTMCIITVFSITFLCYIVGDLDAPFSGVFAIKITVLKDLIYRVNRMYDAAWVEDDVFIGYS